MTHLARRSPEKGVEAIGRKLMAALGFDCWHLSQARATQQSPGWPDMLFTHPTRGLAVWWEAKAPKGKQTDAQRAFEAAVTSCGQEYVAGTNEDLAAWCEQRGLCRVLQSGGIQVEREAKALHPAVERYQLENAALRGYIGQLRMLIAAINPIGGAGFLPKHRCETCETDWEKVNRALALPIPGPGAKP